VTEAQQAGADFPPEVAPLPGAFVYKLRDLAKRVIYIGMTDDLKRRLSAHACDKLWWADVAFVSSAWYEQREAALVAEAVAIQDARPVHNDVIPDPAHPVDGMLSLAVRREFPSPAQVAAMGTVWAEQDIADYRAWAGPRAVRPLGTESQLPKLAGLAEVTALLSERSERSQVSRAYAAQVARHPEFPAPVQVLAMGPVWLEADVVKFIETPRAPGRKRKEDGK
jgi:hypothetical protein